tara:strand:- start:18 stop:617 length:600 start_codon:yes stop_codon:yes gene_type:complete
MRPMKVTAGENAPDVEELIEKANSMDDMLAKVAETVDNSQMRNITGVEEARMSHYWTNQQQPDDNIEAVTNKGAHSETINFDETANPHQTGSTLSAHQNTAGGETVMKAPPMPPDMGGGGPPGGDMGGDPLAALLGGAGGPEGGEDLPDDPMELAKKIEQMGKKIQDMLGGGMDDMGAPPPGGDDMGGEGGPMPMAPGM